MATMSTVKIGHKDVINFFKTADVEMSELVLELASQAVAEKRAAKERIVANLKKARSAKTKKEAAPATQAGTQAGTQAAPQAQAEAASPIQQARARRAGAGAAVGHTAPSVPAPAHTAEATGVASDTLI